VEIDGEIGTENWVEITVKIYGDIGMEIGTDFMERLARNSWRDWHGDWQRD
jgi:hypothetical protein